MMLTSMIMFKKITMNCNIVLEPGECQFKQMQIHNLDDDSWTEWKEF